MSDSSPTAHLSAYLHRVSRRLRWGSIAIGASRLLIALVGLFWVTLGLDYAGDRWLHLGYSPRLVISLVWGTLVLLFTCWWILWRLVARPTDRSIALFIEKRHPELADQLMTAVELRDSPLEGMSPSLVQESARQAWTTLQSIPVETIVPLRSVQRPMGVSFLCAATVALFAWSYPAVTTLWSQRIFTLAMVEYPRRTHLEFITGQQEVTKVPRGRDFSLLVEADTAGVVPDRAWLLLHTSLTGADSRLPMTRQGNNNYRFLFRNLIDPVEFQVTAGDAHTNWHRLEIVESPLITSASVQVRPPSYTGLAEKEVPLSGSAVPVPMGSEVTLHLSTNKPLQSSKLQSADKPIEVRPITQQTFESTFILERSEKLKAQVIDVDGLDLAEAFPIDLEAVADRTPKVEASIVGVSPGVTKQAVIPLRVKADDDYGFGRVEFEITINDQPSTKQPVSLALSEVATLDERLTFDVASLKQEAGTKWTLKVLATDRDDKTGPHTGSSESFPFEIITPEELVARLAGRELQLRQRFEQVVSELRDAERSLTTFRDQPGTEEAAKGLACDRAVTIVRKSGSESKSISLAFTDIIDEFTNNRMANSDVLQRLGKGIVEPLDRLVDQSFPRVLSTMDKLTAALDSKSLEQPLDTTLLALNDTIYQSEQILKAMSKLESFNELVSTLKGIIDDEEKIRDAVQKQRKEKVLDLLKD